MAEAATAPAGIASWRWYLSGIALDNGIELSSDCGRWTARYARVIAERPQFVNRNSQRPVATDPQ